MGIPEQAVVGAYVGRVSQEKAVDRILRIFAVLKEEIPDLHLLLVGGGPSLTECRQLARSLDMDGRVTFTGPVSYERIGGVLSLADFFVSASVSEVHPLTFIEAAAAGLPAIGIDSPGVADMIVDGKTGFLTADNDLSLGLRIMRMARDAELRSTMGQAASRYSQRFSAHHNAREVLGLYHSTAGKIARRFHSVSSPYLNLSLSHQALTLLPIRSLDIGRIIGVALLLQLLYYVFVI